MGGDRPGDGSEPKARAEGASSGETAAEMRLPRKERERARHREDVLRAAEGLLEGKTYSEITVQEIAQKAEFSVGYLYKLFASKEEIFAAVIRSKHEEISRLMDQCLSEPVGVEERLGSIVHGLFAWLNENPAYTSSSVRELLVISHILPGLATEFALREAESLAKTTHLLAEGVRDGVFLGEEPEVMARTLKVLMKGFIQEDLFRGREGTDWTEYAPIVLRIFMRAFAPEGGHS